MARPTDAAVSRTGSDQRRAQLSAKVGDARRERIRLCLAGRCGVVDEVQMRCSGMVGGLPCRGGAQLAVDVTLRSAVGADGEARQGAADVDGAVAQRARRDKEEAYPEVVAARRCNSPCGVFSL